MDGYSTKIKKGYRTVWISDLHLGTSGCKSELLLDFLKQIKTETIYLVGDIVDGWRLKKNGIGHNRTTTLFKNFLEKLEKVSKLFLYLEIMMRLPANILV